MSLVPSALLSQLAETSANCAVVRANLSSLAVNVRTTTERADVLEASRQLADVERAIAAVLQSQGKR